MFKKRGSTQIVSGSTPSGAGAQPLAVGQSLVIENIHVHISRVLAEGGFGSVYLAEDDAGVKYALKRVFVHDKQSMDSNAIEIEILKKLDGCPYIVKLYGTEMRPCGKRAEMLLLLEYCAGGHLVDLINNRLTADTIIPPPGTVHASTSHGHDKGSKDKDKGEKWKRKFGEKEVLRIFSDVCFGLAEMHHQSPPYIHRDIKLENVLFHSQQQIFKLCDFGSATSHPLAIGGDTTMQMVEDEIARFTTLQYRAPEMVDLYRKQVINEKADIWALGCVLYKLLFFEDAFGESTLSILSGRIKIHDSFGYSQDMVALLHGMLEQDPVKRFDIDRVIDHVFKMRKVQNPNAPKQQDKPQEKQQEKEKERHTSTSTPDPFASTDGPGTASLKFPSSAFAQAAPHPPPPQQHPPAVANPFNNPFSSPAAPDAGPFVKQPLHPSHASLSDANPFSPSVIKTPVSKPVASARVQELKGAASAFSNSGGGSSNSSSIGTAHASPNPFAASEPLVASPALFEAQFSPQETRESREAREMTARSASPMTAANPWPREGSVEDVSLLGRPAGQGQGQAKRVPPPPPSHRTQVIPQVPAKPVVVLPAAVTSAAVQQPQPASQPAAAAGVPSSVPSSYPRALPQATAGSNHFMQNPFADDSSSLLDGNSSGKKGGKSNPFSARKPPPKGHVNPSAFDSGSAEEDEHYV